MSGSLSFVFLVQQLIYLSRDYDINKLWHAPHDGLKVMQDDLWDEPGRCDEVLRFELKS